VPPETPKAAGQIAVPDDFDRMGAVEIEQLFGNSA
jgi:hypothetical protein